MIERFAEVVLRRYSDAVSVWMSVVLALAYLACLIIAARLLLCHLDAAAERIYPWQLFLGIGLLFLVFVQLYPVLDSGRLGFFSDRDEALDLAVRQFLSGQYPYHCRAVSGIHHGCPSVGNPIAPLPGALLLSLPFVLVWGSSVQSFFWLIVYYFASRWYTASSGIASVHLLSVLVLSPVLVAELLTGGDLIANTLAVTSLLLIALRARSPVQWLMSGLFLGIALSWRGHFLLMTVPIIVYHIRRQERRKLLVVGGAAAASAILVTIPFWLSDPQGFSPLTIQQRFHQFDHIVSHGNLIATSASTAVGVVLGYCSRDHDQLLVACAAVLITPFLFAAILFSADHARPTLLFFGWYAISSLFFGTLGIVSGTAKTAETDLPTGAQDDDCDDAPLGSVDIKRARSMRR